MFRYDCAKRKIFNRLRKFPRDDADVTSNVPTVSLFSLYFLAAVATDHCTVCIVFPTVVWVDTDLSPTLPCRRFKTPEEYYCNHGGGPDDQQATLALYSRQFGGTLDY